MHQIIDLVDMFHDMGQLSIRFKNQKETEDSFHIQCCGRQNTTFARSVCLATFIPEQNSRPLSVEQMNTLPWFHRVLKVYSSDFTEIGLNNFDVHALYGTDSCYVSFSQITSIFPSPIYVLLPAIWRRNNAPIIYPTDEGQKTTLNLEDGTISHVDRFEDLLFFEEKGDDRLRYLYPKKTLYGDSVLAFWATNWPLPYKQADLFRSAQRVRFIDHDGEEIDFRITPMYNNRHLVTARNVQMQNYQTAANDLDAKVFEIPAIDHSYCANDAELKAYRPRHVEALSKELFSFFEEE